MRRSDFDYLLPSELIAQYPPAQRGASRLLHLDRATGQTKDLHFKQLLTLLRAGDLLVFNNTRVIPARLFGQKASGGQVELLVERVIDQHSVLAQIRASKSPKPGTLLFLDEGIEAKVTGRQGPFFCLSFSTQQSVIEILERIGQIPLPPYIERAPEKSDQQRYQTVYATVNGAVAAPTAGLHFSADMLRDLAAAQIQSAFVTLHVGAGTFQPMRVDAIKEHTMHAEWLAVDEQTCRQIDATRQAGGRVIAVGTTSARALESAASCGNILPYRGDTRLFIAPGYTFRVIDGLITNFHLPQSTLLMLVCALGGYVPVMTAYRHAVTLEYRFFSYGDAMIVV